MTVAPLQLGRSPRTAKVLREQVTLRDGARTTVHLAFYSRTSTEIRVAVVRNRTLAAYCAAKSVGDALVGGFFTRPDVSPLGEVRTRGFARQHTPFDAPFDGDRSCLHVAGGVLSLRPRRELPRAPRGDLLQAGPMLVRDGAIVYDRADDPEGFSAGAHQFDSDITVERHPRAAIALTDSHVIAFACDGRSSRDAGLTLEETAELLAGAGARSAMNLDGGGSTTLIAGGRLRNCPRGGWERPEPGGRAIATALLFLSR